MNERARRRLETPGPALPSRDRDESSRNHNVSVLPLELQRPPNRSSIFQHAADSRNRAACRKHKKRSAPARVENARRHSVAQSKFGIASRKCGNRRQEISRALEVESRGQPFRQPENILYL